MNNEVFKTHCKKCNKEGWIARTNYPNGELLERLFLTMKGIYCEKCVGTINESDKPVNTTNTPPTSGTQNDTPTN